VRIDAATPLSDASARSEAPTESARPRRSEHPLSTPGLGVVGSVTLAKGRRPPDPLAVELALGFGGAALERLALVAELDDRRRELQHAGRLASIGTLAASLAHEIRNPMVSIKTFLQLLPERGQDTEFMGDFLRLSTAEVNRITELLNQMLDLARPGGARYAQADLNTIARRAIALAASELREHNVELDEALDEDLPALRVDSDQVHQVVLNLLLNAAQASPPGERIRIDTGREGAMARLSVTDRGSGIPEDVRSNLFEPFVTTKKGGNGLGLAVSRQIVEEHGGVLEFETRPGQTTFTVRLPIER
jgi:signal transduction histidine kinase